MDAFVKQMEKTIREERMFVPGTRLVAGVSGGADSTALACALSVLAPAWRLSLFLAHLNHGLRAEEADADEEWVKGLGARLCLPVIAGRLGPAPGSNVEAWAREERYRFLAATALAQNASHVALGHHADDNAETVLLNLLRGAGTAGLAGIAPVRQAETPRGKLVIVRPLIRVRRAEILAYLERQGLDFRSDASNQDPRFLRNRVRHQLLPLMESLNPEIRSALVHTAEIARRESELIAGEAREWLLPYGPAEKGRLTIPLPPLRREPAGRRMAVYREAIRAVNRTLSRVSLAHLKAIERLAGEGPAHGALDLPGLRVRREYERLHFLAREGAAWEGEETRGQGPALSIAPAELLLDAPGQALWIGPEGREYTISAEIVSAPPPDIGPGFVAWLDLDRIAPPLVARSRRQGERYQPAGLAGQAKLKKIMNQLGVPPRFRDRWPLIADAEEILWVPPARPAAKAAPGPRSRRLARLEIQPPLPQKK
jgi:tRNA(Ile)-lysidine synthase